MREKLATLSMDLLREMAKDKKIKHISKMKKNDLIEAILKANNYSEDKPQDKSPDKPQEKSPDKPQEKAQNRPQRSEDRTQEKSPQRDYNPFRQDYDPAMVDTSSGDANGILEVMSEGYGFIRCDNFMPGEADVYVAPQVIKRFGLKTGDIILGAKRIKNQGEKFSALLYIKSVNGYSLELNGKEKSL